MARERGERAPDLGGGRHTPIGELLWHRHLHDCLRLHAHACRRPGRLRQAVPPVGMLASRGHEERVREEDEHLGFVASTKVR